jgi:acyl-CoA thioesterase
VTDPSTDAPEPAIQEIEPATRVTEPATQETEPSDVPFPLKDLLGFDVERGEGLGRCRLTVADKHLNPNGIVHGAVPYAMIDTAMGAATVSVLPEDQMCATIEIHTRYLAPCFAGELTATATVRKAGRRVVHLEALVTDGDGREIVMATGSFAVLPRP